MTPSQQNLFAEVIGGFLINFGAVEFSSFLWIEKYSNDKIVRDLAISLRLGQRLELIRTLVKRSDLPEERKETALRLWSEVSEISVLRNTLVHNPLVTNQKTGEIGIIDVKKMKGIGPYKIEPLQIDQIATAAKRISLILQEITTPF